MLGDAHSTNYAENRDFFLNQNNPTNFERTWTTAYFLYKRINAVTEQTPFDQVMDFSIIQKLGRRAEVREPEERVRHPRSPRRAPASVHGEKDEILTKTVVIHFFPNSWDLNKKVTRQRRTARKSRSSTTRTSRSSSRRSASSPASTARRASSSKGTPTAR